jgi:hypothetical protein
LDVAEDESRSEKTDRERFRDECRKNFSGIWTAIGEINKELVERSLGNVELANAVPSSDRFEIIYNFHGKSNDALSMTFCFGSFVGSHTVEVFVGPSCQSKGKRFSVDEIDAAIDVVMSYVAAFYTS